MSILTYEQKLSRLESALTRVERMNMYSPLSGDRLSARLIAKKFHCRPQQVHNIIACGRLKSRKRAIRNNPLTTFAYCVTRYYLKQFISESLSNNAVNSDEVLKSRILRFNDLLRIFDLCRWFLDAHLVEHLTYLDIGCHEFSVKRFVGNALEVNILDMISETLGFDCKVYSTKTLARKLDLTPEGVLFYVENDRLDALNIGSYSNPHYIYLEPEILRFEREEYRQRKLGRPPK